MSRLFAVIPAAGRGSRLGSAVAKQYLEIAGKSLLSWSLDAVLACEDIRVCAVALPDQHACHTFLESVKSERVVACVGGACRADSVRAGIAALGAEHRDWVLVHDAARPCLDRKDLENLVAAVRRRDIGGLLAQPVSDTLKEVSADQMVAATVDRSSYWRAQTPQMFRVGELSKAFDLAQDAEITDEASAMERAGYPVQIIEGSASNLKVTFAEDLELAEFWLRRSDVRSRSVSEGAV